RKKNINFDYSIEIYPDESREYSLVYIFEFKGYTRKSVSINEIETFCNQIDQLNKKNIKGVVISKTKLSNTGVDMLKELGIMYIVVDGDDYDVKLYNKYSNLKKNSHVEISIFEKIAKELKTKGYENVEHLSSEIIEQLAIDKLIQIFNKKRIVDLDVFVNYLFKNESIRVVYSNDFKEDEKGYLNKKKKTIVVNEKYKGKKIESFILAHEYGHYLLHGNVKRYGAEIMFTNPKYFDFNFKKMQYMIQTDEGWIEWQANKFAANFLVNKDLFISEFKQLMLKILGRVEKLFIDQQTVNINTYRQFLKILSDKFNVSNKVIQIRLEECGLVEYDVNKDDFTKLLMSSISELSD
ncbi:ImmA/IrrE family metallo-endopeptidase, partial [bacterium]